MSAEFMHAEELSFSIFKSDVFWHEALPFSEGLHGRMLAVQNLANLRYELELHNYMWYTCAFDNQKGLHLC